MQQLDTKFKLKEILCSAIEEWSETGHVSLWNIKRNFTKSSGVKVQ